MIQVLGPGLWNLAHANHIPQDKNFLYVHQVSHQLAYIYTTTQARIFSSSRSSF